MSIATSRGPFTLEAALDDQTDIVPTLTALQDTASFRGHLEARRSDIQDIICRHLNIPLTSFVLGQPSQWIHGGFNMCLPIDIHDTFSTRLPRKALIRIAMPHAGGQSYVRDAVDEKVRCEAATYVWLEGECPTIPIPRLLGIGFPGSRTFSRVENESWSNWTIWHIRRAIAWFQGSTIPRFVGHNRAALQDLGYLLIEYVDDGVMLSSSWNLHLEDLQKNRNLYSSLAKIMLDLCRIKQPRTGSWTMNDDGNITLTNRPFHDLTAFWGRHNIPLNIPRDMTYSSADSYIPDLLAYQDARMEHQPNSILDRDDGVSQLSALVGLRALFPKLFNAHLSRGHFVMNFTDMHQSNIFVDKDWNITRLIDLEFAYSCPVELVHVPPWLTGRGVDQLHGPDEERFKLRYDDFVEAVAEEERAKQQGDALSQRLREDWSSGRYWYLLALSSINAYPSIFNRNLRPRYYKDFQFETDAWPLAQLWSENVSEFINAKVDGMQAYNDKVRQVFHEVAESQGVTVVEPAKAE